MDEGFDLPVDFGGKTHQFPAKLVMRGYTYALAVEIEGITIQYERDEEGKWRALVVEEDLKKNRQLSVALLSATADAIDEILK